MATPIRMAPVLYGKEAEFFFEQWEKMRNTPLQRPTTPEKKREMLKFMKKHKLL